MSSARPQDEHAQSCSSGERKARRRHVGLAFNRVHDSEHGAMKVLPVFLHATGSRHFGVTIRVLGKVTGLVRARMAKNGHVWARLAKVAGRRHGTQLVDLEDLTQLRAPA